MIRFARGWTVSLEQAKDWAEIAGVVTAVLTLWKGVYEYTKQAAQKRAEHFIQMRDRYGKFRSLCAQLEQASSDDESRSGQAKRELRKLPFDQKRDFLGFYEEIALMMNRKLIRKDVAHYMFGYYAIRCWESDAFWNAPDGNLNRKSFYWGVFRSFAERMMKMEIDGRSARSFERYRI